MHLKDLFFTTKKQLLLILLFGIAYPLHAQKQVDRTKFVSPFVGTSGDHGQLTPSATLPFGLVKLGAETNPGNQAGYDYASLSVKGYPLCIGEPVYSLTSPILSKATIRLPGNKTFVISTKTFSDSNFYIQRASLNGRPLNRCWITHQEIINGGNLVYTLGNKPNKAWGLEKPYITQITQE